MRIKQRITPVSGNTGAEEREAEKQKKPTIHKYLAHLTVLYAKILERKMETALEKRVVNNDDFSELSRGIYLLGYLIDLHDKVEKTKAELLKS